MMKYKSYPSKYELYHITWGDIGYNKEKLIKLLKRIKLLRIFSFIGKYRDELKILKEILDSYDKNKLNLLLSNDEKFSKTALIEKWSRIGAIEILTSERFSKETFKVISNLPIKDYQILTKRIEELINLARNVTTQSDNNTKDIPIL